MVAVLPFRSAIATATTGFQKSMSSRNQQKLAEARERFIAQWGAIGTAWGINRSMAQLHACLLVASRPLTTDAVMEQLDISRGNANANLRDLVDWGLVRQVVVRGERKQYFEAEKNTWKIFCIIARERKKRELEPALDTLREAVSMTAPLTDDDARVFNGQVEQLADFLTIVSDLIEKVVGLEENQVIPKALRLFK
jgi:DNA-binding transcriptional regulator GbsR (MarR family)